MLSPTDPARKAEHEQKRAEFKKAATSKTHRRKSPAPLTIRLSENERTTLKQRAAQDGVSVSAYVRARLFGGSGKRSGQTSLDWAALARLLGLLGQSGIADSLKRVADHASNGSLLLDDETHANIDAACAHIMLMRNCLIAALGLRETRKP